MRSQFDTVAHGQALHALIYMHYAARCPLMLHGGAGVGKSAAFKEACAAQGMGLRVINLAVCDATDLAGLPMIVSGRTEYATANFWPTPNEKPGLLLLEEPNRAETQTLAPIYDVMTSGRLGPYVLPDGWVFAACVNDEGHVYSLDPAFVDLFSHVNVVADRDAFLEFAQREEFQPEIVHYVRSLPPEQFGVDPSPRSWHYASNLLRAAKASGATAEQLRAGLAGLLGRDTAARLVLSMRSDRIGLQGPEVLDAYPTFQSLVREWVAKGRVDHLLVTVQSVETALQRRGPTAPESVVRRHVTAFAGDLKGDLRERALAMLRSHVSGGA